MTKIKEWPCYRPAVQIFSCFAHERDAVFLDSSLENQYGQYAIIGIRPYLKVEDRNGQLFIDGVARAGSFQTYISDYLKAHREENPTSLPILSGAIGYITYDFGMMLSNIRSRHSKEVDMPDGMFLFYEHFIIDDKINKRIYLTAAEQSTHGHESLDALERELRARLDLEPPDTPIAKDELEATQIESDFQKEAYLDAVNKVIRYIIDGDIYITNMTRQIIMASQVPPYDIYLRLHKENPAPFAGYLNYGDFQILCSSPERFVKSARGKVETRPIKGTRRRGETPEEDGQLRQELLSSEKDKSELLMIVDLERNDLNKICKPGSVKVSELFAVEAYATVFHLVSTIVGELKEGITAMDLLAALSPGGSITGAPKRRSMEIIDELEHSRRGLYTGSIGYLALDGSCDFNIVIRTLIHQDGLFHCGVGGGITCESDPEFEFEETEQKAKALLEAAK